MARKRAERPWERWRFEVVGDATRAMDHLCYLAEQVGGMHNVVKLAEMLVTLEAKVGDLANLRAALGNEVTTESERLDKHRWAYLADGAFLDVVPPCGWPRPLLLP